MASYGEAIRLTKHCLWYLVSFLTREVDPLHANSFNMYITNWQIIHPADSTEQCRLKTGWKQLAAGCCFRCFCSNSVTCCCSTSGGAVREMCELLSRNTMYCQVASCLLLYTHIALWLREMHDWKLMMDAAGLKRQKHSPSHTLLMQHTSGEGSQSADNPPDTTNSTDLHNRALVSRITLIPSSFICPIPCLLSRDMRQETKH